MVAYKNVPPGDNKLRQVGLFHHNWLAGFLIICSLVALQPGSLRMPAVPTRAAEQDWLYRRDGEIPPDQGPTAQLLVVGDVMLGRGVARINDPFRDVKQLLASADFTIGNFEGVISSQDLVTATQIELYGSTPYRLVAPVRAAVQLQEAGFDLLSLANNHSMDRGTFGLMDTIGRLERVGIQTLGVGTNLENAYRPLIKDVKGVRIAFLAIDAIPEPISAKTTGQELKRAIWDKNRVMAIIRQLVPVSDVIIVIIHWGDEYEIRAGPNQRLAAQEMVEGRRGRSHRKPSTCCPRNSNF